MEGGEIEIVKDFIYLDSNLSADGEATREVNCHIAKVSKAFGSLQMPIFSNCTFSVHIKRTSNSFYSAETWTLKAPRLTIMFVPSWEYQDSNSGMSSLFLNNCQLGLVCLG